MTARFTGRCLSPLMSASVNSLSREKGALVPTGEGGICDTQEYVGVTHASHYELRVQYSIPCTTAPVRCACGSGLLVSSNRK